MYRSNELLAGWVLFLVIVIAGALYCLKLLADFTGLPFWDVLSNARVLLLGPVVLVFVIALERFDVQLPLRVENTWPVIAGLFWIGIHRLLVLKAEAGTPAHLFPDNFDYPDSMVNLPWYAETWFLWVILLVIVIGGYMIRKSRNSY
jgi:hypothetical protein